MQGIRLAGFVVLFIGLILFGLGIYSSNTEREQVVRDVTGRDTENTMCYFLGGVGLILGGAALVYAATLSPKK